MSQFEGESFLRAIIDAIPSPLFVVDEDVKILAFNESAQPLLAEEGMRVLFMRAGDALHCIHAGVTPQGCGHAEACKTCVVRNSVGECFREERVTRRFQRMQLAGPAGVRDAYLLVITAPLHHEGAAYATLLFQDIGDLVETGGLLPVCMHCHRVREGTDDWSNVETYLHKHLDISFSHGLCPECLRKHYPESAREILG